MKAVNLIPLERRQAASGPRLTPLVGRGFYVGFGAVAAAAVLGLAALAYFAITSVDDKRRELDQVQTELALTPPKKQAIPPAALATAASRRATIVGIADRQLQWDGLLASISRVIPENVWLSGLTANPSGAAVATASVPAAAGAAAPTTPFAIKGYTYSQSSVARVLDRLELSPWLSQVQLTGTTLAPVGTRSVFEFTIGASVTTSGGAS